MTSDYKKHGIVYLVGAGPGHPGLITRLGYDLLQQCDAIAYDALTPMELIVSLPQRIERHYVGKRAGKHSLPQSQINELLVKLAQRGLKVVRLKGGDPSIFGRSGEEAEHLSNAGIPVVIVPGVTSASAASAMSGFSLTNRRAASWVLLGTGHGAENLSIPVPWNRVAALAGGTIVIYMGLAKLDQVVGQLLSAGMDPATPAIAVQAASTGLQRSIEAPLLKLTEECGRQRLKPPALVVIGKAVRCRANETRTGMNPLAGKTVLVTSALQETGNICQMLREKGAEPIPHPTVVRRQADDTAGWERFAKLVEGGGWCWFMNKTEVGCFFAGLFVHGLDLRSLGCFKVAASDHPTAAALLEWGINADLVLEGIEQPAIPNEISKQIPAGFSSLVWVGGSPGKYPPEAGRCKEWAEVIPLTVCLDSPATWEPHWKEDLLETPPDYITFTDIAEVKGFVELLGADEAGHLSSKSCIASINTSVTEMLHQHGLIVGVESFHSRLDALIAALVDHAQE